MKLKINTRGWKPGNVHLVYIIGAGNFVIVYLISVKAVYLMFPIEKWDGFKRIGSEEIPSNENFTGNLFDKDDKWILCVRGERVAISKKDFEFGIKAVENVDLLQM